MSLDQPCTRCYWLHMAFPASALDSRPGATRQTHPDLSLRWPASLQWPTKVPEGRGARTGEPEPCPHRHAPPHRDDTRDVFGSGMCLAR